MIKRNNAVIGTQTRRIATTLVALAALFAASTATAAVNNLESYHLRHDFSTGARVALLGPQCTADFIVTGNETAVAGPNGAANAVHPTHDNWGAVARNGSNVSADYLAKNDWTVALCLYPGSTEKGVLFAVGRQNTTNGRSAISLCSSSDPTQLYLYDTRKKDKAAVETGHETITGLSNMTNGFHTVVMSYAKASSNLTVYVDGVKKVTHQIGGGNKSYYIGEGLEYCQTMSYMPSFLTTTWGSDSDASFYDMRFYFGAFNDSDAAAYAALYPADRMGSPFRPNAYIEAGATNTISSGINITTPMSYIDTGYTAKKGTEFALDFQYLDCATIQQYAFGVWNGNASSTPTVDGLTHCFYINGKSGFAFTKFSGTSADWHAITADNKADRVRRIVTVDNKDDSDTGSTATILTWEDRSTMASASTTKDHAVDAIRSTYLFAINANDEAKRFTKARIYSFEADESGAPALFLVPDMENGEAGFRNIIDGSFHGDGNKNNNPERTLRFYDGVGRASDYKYEDSTLYAKLYATSGANGTVSVAEGAAAASAEGWVPRGGTLALSAVPAANMEFKEWIGDTWAIADGFGTTDASVNVSTPYAVQLRATFKPAVNAQLTIAADGADAIAWSAADWRDVDDSSVVISAPIDKEVTIVAHKSVTLSLDADVSLSKFIVQADTNCVVAFTSNGGSFYASEVVVSSGVLKQGSASMLGATPKVTVEDGGTFDVNNLAADRRTVFSIAGAGAGNWPWALTSSVAVTDDHITVDIVNLADNATIGGDCAICIGVRSGATFNKDTETLPLTLNGYTLTKTGAGRLWFRRPYSTNDGTIDVKAGTLEVTGWSNQTAEYGESCVSNIALIAREGTTVKNSLSHTLYFKSLDLNGATMASNSGAVGVWESLSGHGSSAKLTMAGGATAVLEGNLTVSGALTAVRDLSLTRAAGVETNVTVAVTGTLTATNAITVGAGVIFDIGTNRPAGTFTVDDDATLVLRKADIDDDEIVLKASAQPRIVLYNIYGVEIQNPDISYDQDAGTVTVRAPSPRWTNTDGSGSLDSVANWTAVPSEGDDVVLDITGDVAITSSGEKTFNKMKFDGAYSVDFSGADTITLSSIELNNLTNLVTGGKLKFTSIAIPQTCTVTITGGEGLGDGGLTGKGTLVVDPGAGNTYTMTKSNTSFTGEAVIKSGTVKFGDSKSFGPIARSSVIRVKGGATLDENGNNAQDYTYGKEKQTAVLEDGARLVSKPGVSDTKLPPLTTLTLEGDATVDTSSGKVSISQHYNDNLTHIKLGTHTLTKVGANDFFVSQCKIEGTGIFDIKKGAVVSTHDYGDDSTTTCANGTIRIREGASWKLASYNGHVSKLSVKNLILDGSVTRDANTYTLTVTGSITGNGTTPMLTMGSGAVFKPSGTGYLSITGSLSGKLKLDVSGLGNISGRSKIPLVKVPSSLAATAEAAIEDIPAGWKLVSKEDGGNVEYYLYRPSFSIFLR